MPEQHILIQGAGRGVGLALVKQLLRDDHVRLSATVREPENAEALQTLVTRHGSERLAIFALDLSDEDSIRATCQAVGQRHPRLDLMMICAGLLHDDQGLWPEKQLADIDPELLARSFAINATGPALMIKHFHTLLSHGERAVIASLSARVGSISDNRLGGWYAYRAAKAAQNQLTRSAAIELKRKSKRLICVGLHPGTVNTELSAPFQKRVPRNQLQTAEQAAGHLLDVVARLTPADSGQLFDWAGKQIEP